MKNNLLFRSILISAFFISSIAKGQNDNIGYAVTDSISNGIKWNFLRTVDISTGIYSDTLLRLLSNDELLFGNGIISCNGVAAIAHDKKSKRVYFTPMLLDKLSYVDLKTMTIHVAVNNFTGLLPKQTDQSNIFTRMVIADDGNGYALSNDGNHLIKFTVGKTHAATDLGSLSDAPGNNENSIHSACSSWGGDMVSDDDGYLYLVTFRNHIFKIEIQSRIATYLGTVNGVPANFSTSGVAVNQHGNKSALIIASSIDASNVYSLDLTTLAASGLNSYIVKHSSDLSNSAILKTKKQFVPPGLVVANNASNSKIQLYPNPVTSGEFKIQFTNIETGNYTVDLIDAKGRVAASKKIVSLGAKNNIVVVNISELMAKGIFIVRITDKNNKAVFSDKLILQ